ncbi:MAG: enzyme of heme biosynthesis [Actinobacteria bacterium]|nr:enzyme of heme biosynthesis [Actinomycetota bacterium]
MKRLLPVVLVLVSLLPFSAVADDQGSSSAPSPVVTLPATNPKANPSSSVSKSISSSTNTSPTLATTLASIRKLVESKSYAVALVALKKANKDFPNNTDINNLLGFASRNLKQYSASDRYYAKALQLNPNHLGALEYQGELFLKLKKLDFAKANLAKLKKLCGTSCEEFQDLQKAILSYT